METAIQLSDQGLHREAEALRLIVEMLPAGNGDCLWIEYGSASAGAAWAIASRYAAARSASSRCVRASSVRHGDFPMCSIAFLNDDSV